MAALDRVERDGVEGMAYIRPTSASQLQAGLALACFCPVSLATGGQAGGSAAPSVQRANPALGYLAWKEQVYGFASNTALQVRRRGRPMMAG